MPQSIVHNRYQLAGSLREGSHRTIYSTEDLFTGRTVLLKTARRTTDEQTRSNPLLDEYTILASLSHPHIVRPANYGSCPAIGPYYTLEQISGVAFDTIQARLTREEMRALLVQLLHVIYYLESRGIQHNAIAPEHLLVDRVAGLCHVTLVGFGHATRNPEDASGTDLLDLITLFAPLAGLPQAHPQPGIVPASLLEFLLPGIGSDEDLDLPEAIGHLQASLPDDQRRQFLAPHFRRLPLHGNAASSLDQLKTPQPNQLTMSRVQMIHGEAGVGKSRLLTEVQYFLEALGYLCFTIAARPHDRPLFETLSLVSQQVRFSDAPNTATGGGSARDQIPQVQALESNATAFPGHDNDRLVWSLRLSSELREAAAHLRFALLLDDLQSFSADDIDLLRFLVAAPDGPILILASRLAGTHRAQVDDFHDFLSSRPEIIRHTPRAFSESECRELLVSPPLWIQSDPEMTQHLHRLTSGTPLLLEELLSDLALRGSLAPASRGWKADVPRILSSPIPASLAGLAERQIAAIPECCSRIADYLAVLDAPADALLLGLLLGREPARIQEDLARLFGLDVLHQTHLDTLPKYAIRGGLLRDSLYARLPLSLRRSMHSRIAGVLAPSITNESSGLLAVVAHHYIEALDFQNGPEYAFRAARAALRNRLTHRAIELFKAGLDLTPADQIDRRFEGLGMVAWLNTHLGQSARARDFYTEMLLLARRNGERTQEARAVHGLAECLLFSGDSTRGFAYATEAESLALAAGDLPGRARSMGMRTQAYLNLGQIDKAESLASSTLDLALAAEDHHSQSYAKNTWGLVCVSRGDYDKAVHAFEEALEIKTRSQDYSGIAMTLNNLGFAFLENGHLAEAMNYLERARIESQEKGLAFPLTFAAMNIGEVERDLGRPRDATRTLREALALSEGTGRTVAASFALAMLGAAHVDLGLFSKATQFLDRAADNARTTGSKSYVMVTNIYTSTLLRSLGKLPEARQEALDAIRASEALDAPLYKALAIDALVDVSSQSSDIDESKDSLKSLLPAARRGNRLREQLYLMTALARVHLASEEPRKAVTPAREAVRLAKEGGLALHEMKAAQLEGRALLLSRQPEEACRILEESAARMKEMELRPLTAETLYWLAQAQEATGNAAAAAQSTFASAALISAIAAEIEEPEMRESYFAVPLNRAVLQRTERLERAGLTSRATAGAATHPEPDTDLLVSKAFDEVVREQGAGASPRRILTGLLDRALSMVRADRALLILLDADHADVEIARNLEKETIDKAEGFDLTALAQAREGRASVGNDPPLLCAPITTTGESEKVLGAIYLDARAASRFFRDHDLRVVSAFASRAAYVLAEAQETRVHHEKTVLLNRELARRYDMTQLIGESPAMERLFRMMEAVISAECNVLLAGESGTGKELVARAIHYAGARKDQNFVTLNCGAVPDTLIESELFGHKKGAFSGAEADRTGLFEEADGGTLFLDEIGVATPAFQAKLLRVLQSGELRRLGETLTRKVDVRIVAATNANIESAISEGRFREDLYYRLNVVTLTLPPLRDRREDIPILAEHFARTQCETRGLPFQGIGEDALARLQVHAWPGNVRELEHSIESALLLSKGGVIRCEHLPEKLGGANLDHVRELLVENDVAAVTQSPAQERPLIEKALVSARGDKSQAARILGWSRMKLYRRLRALGIPYDAGRASI